MVKSNLKKPKKKLSKVGIVLIIACVIIAVPIFVFLAIIISASIKTGKPILGSRFSNDLNPKITSAQIEEVTNNVKAIGDVEDCEIVLTTADFRVNVDAKDSISESDAEALAKKVYDAVNSKLPVSTYFSISSAGEKMYDLAITVYNYIPSTTDDDAWVSCLVTKNSKMSEPIYEWLSKAKDEKLAQELRNGEPIEEVDEETASEDQPISETSE